MANHESHRAGPLKQTNKVHKHGRHRSKGAIDKAMQNGKISIKGSEKRKLKVRREQRRNQMNQFRKKKREEALAIKRQLGGHNTAPFLVCLLPMHMQIDGNSALAILESCDKEAIISRSESGVTYLNSPRLKQRFAFIVPPIGRGHELTVLDYLKVADTTVLISSAAMGDDDVFDKWGHRIFNMISAQGIPTPIVTLMDLESINAKRRVGAKAAAQKFISKILRDEKILQLDTESDGFKLLRCIGLQKKKVLHNKANRPHMFGDVVQFVPNTNSSISTSVDPSMGTLSVTGYLRGKPLSVNGLVHIPGLGDFQMSHIDAPLDPFKQNNDANVGDNQVKTVACAEPNKQTTLQSEHIIDEMDAEQTWPTKEEIELAQKETKQSKLVKRIPKGWSDIQAAWIPEVETDDNDDDENDDDDENEDDDDDDFMSCENKSFDEEFEKNKDSDYDDNNSEDYADTASVSDAVAINDDKYDQQMDFQEERETMRKIKESRLDELWPDEIDTPLDVAARERFQKYRGLESFRTSPWDPRENLPKNYARIYRFKNFDRTKRRIIAEAGEILTAPQPGDYIKVHIMNVPTNQWEAFKSTQAGNNVILYGMLPHEQCMSVMNVVLKRLPDSEVPIKSKEKLIIQCGYRRFIVNPIFSQHTNGDKHKFERYFRPHDTVCATFYAPIQFPPAPVLAFKENPDTTLALVARGCVISCNPDRIVLKRVVLSGHPMRINRKSATVRYMLFNKEDVDYFKPVKLRTKCGRLGHIKESLGTHGHMKCVFDGQLRSYDTVFMYLYKRMYPKWTYEQCIASCPDKMPTQVTQKMEQ